MEQVTDAERGKLGKAARGGAQAAVGVAVFLVAGAVLVGGVVWALGHRWSPSAPDLSPSLPTLPGKDPEPQR